MNDEKLKTYMQLREKKNAAVVEELPDSDVMTEATFSTRFPSGLTSRQFADLFSLDEYEPRRLAVSGLPLDCWQPAYAGHWHFSLRAVEFYALYTATKPRWEMLDGSSDDS